MAQVDRLSVTMPPEIGAAVRDAATRQGTSVSSWLTEAAAQRLRNELLGAALDRWEAEDGPFSDEEAQGRRDRSRRPPTSGGGVSAVLDAGALIAVDKRDRKIGAMLRVLQRDGVPVVSSAGALAQVWRDGRRQANLARVVSGVDIDGLDEASAKKVGELLHANRSDDLVDAHVALLVHPADQVLTSDEPDIKSLLRTRRVRARIIRV